MLCHNNNRAGPPVLKLANRHAAMGIVASLVKLFSGGATVPKRVARNPDAISDARSRLGLDARRINWGVSARAAAVLHAVQAACGMLHYTNIAAVRLNFAGSAWPQFTGRTGQGTVRRRKCEAAALHPPVTVAS